LPHDALLAVIGGAGAEFILDVETIEAAEGGGGGAVISFSAEIHTRGFHWFSRLLAGSEHVCDQSHSSLVFTHLTS
jgi:hypothetical protein